MSSANLEIVRSVYAAWERGDYTSGDWADPAFELEMADGPDPSTWTGLPAVAEGWFGFLGAWTDYRTQALKFREIDSERVYVLIEVSGRGRTSGLEMRRTTVNVATLRAGKVTRLVIYWDSENALAELASAPET